MVVEESANRLAKKQDFIHIAILLVVALSIGVYLIATTILIAQDGVSYINYAKGLAATPLKIIRDCSEYAPRAYTPGYPFLILMTHKLVDVFGDGSTVSSWVYSAQAINLLCRILALIPLYLIGKEFVDRKLSFWAILILVMLPYPARMGSDVLRDWAHMLFLATGFLLLLRAAKSGKGLLFCLAGLIAGFGYTIRPVCAQLIVYGIFWLILALFIQKVRGNMSRAKLAAGLTLLIIGFTIVAAPYMKIRGEFLPLRLQQIMESFSSYFVHSGPQEQNISGYAAKLVPSDITKAFGKLANRILENLMYYFAPALFIGMYYHFRRKTKSVSTFFITAFVLANIIMVILRYHVSPFLSRRYILPLITFTIFFVPLGLQIMSRWVVKVFSKGVNQHEALQSESRRWFFVLLIIGLAICVPKLFRPIRIEKKGYRLAAQWLKENSRKGDIIVVPDERISFYAERKGIRRVGKSARYIVKRLKDEEEPPAGMIKMWSSYLNDREKKDKVVIYKRK
ncbi:MAG: hypothetical protein AMJ43_09835 [Coxiella sp. DG_40]|nr:MAG: hypothetical protein AMJ43_09835 [Coxiella sp. DG_40]